MFDRAIDCSAFFSRTLWGSNNINRPSGCRQQTRDSIEYQREIGGQSSLSSAPGIRHPIMDFDMEIFDEETSQQIKEEYQRDVDEAAKAIGARRMGLITGDAEAPPTTGAGLKGKLSALSSAVFSKKKEAPSPSPSPPTTTVVQPPPTPPTSENPDAMSTPPNAGLAPHASPTAATSAAAPGAPEAGDEQPPPAPASAILPAAQQLKGEERVAPVAQPEAPLAAEGVTSENVAHTVDAEVKVVPFDVREPSLGAAVVGHVAILEGSCYVWAATEGAAAQGSLAAAVGTRFNGGMPVATPLLAGVASEGSGGSGLSVSMAQRLCKCTGRMVFVSCDLPEDSQILVAAVEAKVVALLKT